MNEKNRQSEIENIGDFMRKCQQHQSMKSADANTIGLILG